MSNTTFDEAMDKALWMLEQGIKVGDHNWGSMLYDVKNHPVLLGKAIEALESEYAGLKASVDESTWMLEHLLELAHAAQKDAFEAA